MKGTIFKQKNGQLTMSIAEFAATTGISRNLAYSLARQNKLPIPVIRLGEKRMVVSCKAVEKLLDGESATNEGK